MLAAGLLTMLMLQVGWIRAEGDLVDPEQALFDRLLGESAQYNIRVRPPVFDEFGKRPPVNVNVTFGLYTVVGVDETLESASIYAFVWETWLDPRLAWDPTDHAGIDLITVSTQDIWIPDVFIFNWAMGNSDDKGSRTHAIVKSLKQAENFTARVTLTYGALFQERCPLDMFYYPFDVQTCQFCLGAMASTNSQVLFHANPHVHDKGRSTKGSEWILVDALGVDDRYREFSNACIRLTLQRRPTFYGVNLFFPTITICLLNTVGLFSHLSDTHNQLDIATLGQTTLLSLGVILLTVAADQTPKGATVSLLGAFFIAMICQTLVATFTAIYLRYSHRQHHLKLSSRSDASSTAGGGAPTSKRAKIRKWLWSVRWERVCMFVHIVFMIAITTALVSIGGLTKKQEWQDSPDDEH